GGLDFVRDLRGELLDERLLVTERPEVELQRFGLDALHVGLVVDFDRVEVRLARQRTQRGELVRRESHSCAALGSVKRLEHRGADYRPSRARRIWSAWSCAWAA